jgi:hypothetical protein
VAPMRSPDAWPRQKTGACQLHNVEGPRAFHGSSALPVMPTARHGILFCLNLLAKSHKAW